MAKKFTNCLVITSSVGSRRIPNSKITMFVLDVFCYQVTNLYGHCFSGHALNKISLLPGV
jgi:hypothetical protein